MKSPLDECPEGATTLLRFLRLATPSEVPRQAPLEVTWWTFRIFFIFFCSGEGKGESGATGREEGRFFLLKISGGGGVSQEGVEGREVSGRESAGNLGELGGGGLNIFFGAEMPAKVRN